MTTSNESKTPETDAKHVELGIEYSIMSASYFSMRDFARRLERERDHWRANHDDAVKRCALLRDRHDLPVDRIAAYKELVRLQEEVKAMKKGSGDEAAVDGLPEGSAVDHDKIALVRFVEGVRDTAIALDDSLEDWRASRRLSNPPTSLYPSVLLVEAPRRLKDAANALLEQVGTRAQSGMVGEGEYHRLIPCCMRDRNRDGDCDQHPQGVFVRRSTPPKEATT